MAVSSRRTQKTVSLIQSSYFLKLTIRTVQRNYNTTRTSGARFAGGQGEEDTVGNHSRSGRGGGGGGIIVGVRDNLLRVDDGLM